MRTDPPLVDDRLSKIVVDVTEKSWDNKRLTSLRQMKAGAALGDVVVRDGAEVTNLPPGASGNILTTQARTNLPNWTAPPD